RRLAVDLKLLQKNTKHCTFMKDLKYVFVNAAPAKAFVDLWLGSF
ncbi:MAG: hypothetical protein ACI9O8_001613, partial [Patiriisocius sp.]